MKRLLTNLGILIFCILFMKGYMELFGEANSTIGVSLLTGIFVYMAADLGLKKNSGAIAIFVSFAIIAATPRLSMWNPYFGLFVNVIGIFLILLGNTYHLEHASHISVMLGYLFAIGAPVTGKLYDLRVISFLVGGALIGVIYFYLHKEKESDKGLLALLEGINIKNDRTKWQLKLSIAISIAIFLGQIVNYNRIIWVCFAILSIIHPDKKESRMRMYLRLPAVLIGAEIFWLIFTYVIPVENIMLVALASGFIMMFFSRYLTKTIMGNISALIAAVSVLSFQEAIYIRIVSNIIGIILILIIEPILDYAFNRIQ